MLTLFGLLGDHPPRDPDGFVAFAGSLRFPDLRDAVADAEPIDDPVTYRFTADVRRRHDRMTRVPDGFLVMGDALCSFNPIYGQGMTVAALQALALRDRLPIAGRGTRRTVHALARAVDVPWQLATGADLAVPEVDGPCPPRLRLVNGARASPGASCDLVTRRTKAWLRSHERVKLPLREEPHRGFRGGELG
jgi:hypothetical protein